MTEELAVRRSLPEDPRLGACGRGDTPAAGMWPLKPLERKELELSAS